MGEKVKQFLRMVQSARSKGVRIAESNGGPTVAGHALRDFFNQCERAQNFVFADNCLPALAPITIEDENGKIIRKKFDAPFPVFTIENVQSPIALDLGQKKQIKIWCILAYEISPMNFAQFSYAHMDGEIDGFVVFGNAFDQVISKYIETMNSKSIGTERVRERVKIGPGQEKRTHTIRRIIHIRHKNEMISAGETGNPIDWTHRWLVRGHWRKTDLLGKDREGNYCVTGFTWVKEHEKGPEDMPLITKTRLVHA